MKIDSILKKISYSFLVIVLTVSCKHKEGEYHSITDKIEAKSKYYNGVSISSENHIGNMKLMEVTENGLTFLIPERKSKIKSFACTECHSKPLSKMQEKDLKKAHWNIKLKHADSNTMNCLTCHNGTNMNELQSITGHKIDFNNSYKLCSQCHQKQYKDWTGGAHGKSLKSWAPPRASMTCVNCHNPHTPSFEKKWPERYSIKKTNERK